MCSSAVELFKHEGTFKNKREVHLSSTSALENSEVLTCI